MIGCEELVFVPAFCNQLRTAATPDTNHDKWNCRTKQECPLDMMCLYKNIVYKATVTTDTNDRKQSYIQ